VRNSNQADKRQHQNNLGPKRPSAETAQRQNSLPPKQPSANRRCQTVVAKTAAQNSPIPDPVDCC